MSKYLYTLLYQDGNAFEFESEKLDFHDFYKLLDCELIEIIPSDYCPKEWGRCTVYGDEEGRFSSNNVRNPHTLVLGEGWDCVGNLIKEEKVK